MDQSNRCPRCGAARPVDRKLHEMCPACLLEIQIEPEADPRVAEPVPLGADMELLRTRFPHLELQEEIGRGGMGAVYRARHRGLDRLVALKVLDPALATEEGFAQRFEREARALARLDHPNVVAVHDVGEVEGTYFLTMEFVEGQNLRELMRSGSLDALRALALVPQICAGLQYAHEHGVVHRDVKPENILVDHEGRVKVADFGLAKLLDRPEGEPSLTRHSQAMGTPQYMAPEQLRGSRSVDHRADIYSLGVVLYELLTGDLPIGNFRLPSDCAAVDERLDGVVLKALEPEPAQRYQRVSEVREGIENEPPPKTPAAAGANWYSAVPGGAIAIVIATVALSWIWIAAVRMGSELKGEWAALAYPIAFLGFSVARELPRKERGAPYWASLATLCAALFACSTAPGPSGIVLLLALFAALLVVGAHLLIERWLHSGEWALFAAAAALFIGAVVLHAAPKYAPGRDAYYFSSGILALIAAASLGALVPRLAAGGAARGDRVAVLRALAVALVACAFYFHRQIF